MNAQYKLWRHKPTVALGILLYLGYLAIFFTVWAINGVDYSRIGESAETMKLWYALPTLTGCAFLVYALSVLGWWRLALFDRFKSGPKWAWILPIVMTAIILTNILILPFARVSTDMVLWSLLGALGVGFGEEVAARGSLIVGLRSRFGEVRVWLISSLLFAALHIPNVFFGQPLQAMPIQVVFTFIMGSGFYTIRRLSGSLILPIVLHGLWDSAQFLHIATQSQPSITLFLIYPVAIICTIAVVLKNRNVRLPS